MKLTIGAVVAGGTSLAYKTGPWREQRPVIDKDACKQCGICQEVCPDDAVCLIENKYTINFDYCKGCGICAYECPVKAIAIVTEEK
ncbi:MAG: 4Fe-4S binding protein [Pseudomonadota bacterium]|nr:4Fe-4S binding protein [Pseudomonadota bacterium]MBU1570253.1 4Fe-4S binding protein [Pseudomonadota bacterium]